MTGEEYYKKWTYKIKPLKKYWYRTEIQVCVLCGREKKNRYRVYDRSKSGTIISEDACYDHF